MEFLTEKPNFFFPSLNMSVAATAAVVIVVVFSSYCSFTFVAGLL